MARKILLADDSVTAQNMGRRILTDAGYDVITVNNGSAALKKITEQKPDVIVLDVYMPGYGGLEVCQRIKETRDTSRIPVLLTVGKLEPFKPEEARRARADAFIVKPFEASELLAALAKLEDRIVPQSDQKGRKKHTAEDFGDTDTGWKSRLNVPPPHKKKNEDEEERDVKKSEPEPVEAKKQPEPEVAKAAEPEVSKAPEPEVSKTPEAEVAKAPEPEATKPPEPEVAKTSEPETAASAAVTPTPVPGDISADEMAAIAAAAQEFQNSQKASQQPATDPAPSPVVAEANVVAEKKEEVTELPVVPAPVAEEPPSVPAGSVPTPTVAANEVAPAAEVKLAESEVIAALDSLSPAKETASEVPTSESAPALSGPRWVAEEVEVNGEDATYILEREMEKALAAIAGANGTNGNSGLAVAGGDSEKTQAEAGVLVAHASVSSPDEASSTPSVSLDTGVSNNAQTIAPSSEELKPAAEGSAEDQILQAAAAAVGASLSELSSAPEASAIPGGTEAQPHDTEPTAAWEHWRTVRDSVIGGQSTAHRDEQAADGFKDIRRETPSLPVSDAKEKEDPIPEPDAIANIVDSVLAELKPKLMEQIAKKLADEKK